MLDLGHRLDDRYEVDALVADGGMASVYHAHDTALGRDVAVKVLSPRLAPDPTSVARFEQEAKAAASLNHPNVVGVFDAGETDGARYIVMEYVDGRTLAEEIEIQGRIRPDVAVRIASDVCTALGAAHAHGIVHRDVKPGNILLTPDGQVKVTDFGIARLGADTHLTQTATMIGTALYIAPEQARGAEVDERTDVYGLGCVLYEMLGGRPPFPDGTPLAVANQHVSTAPPPLPDDVPDRLRAVTMRALAKEPAQRFASTDDMRRALVGQAATTVPLGAAATERIVRAHTEMLPRPPRQSRVPLWAAAVALVLLLLAAALALTRDGGTEVAAEPTMAPTPTVTSAPATPAPTPAPATPAPATAAPADPQSRLAALLSGGGMDAKTARELTKRLEEIVRLRASGDTDKALEKIDDTRDWLDDREEKGDIAPATADAIDQQLATLEQAWSSGSSDDDDDDGPPGRARGHQS